jgi:hypothetical protein
MEWIGAECSALGAVSILGALNVGVDGERRDINGSLRKSW